MRSRSAGESWSGRLYAFETVLGEIPSSLATVAPVTGRLASRSVVIAPQRYHLNRCRLNRCRTRAERDDSASVSAHRALQEATLLAVGVMARPWPATR